MLVRGNVRFCVITGMKSIDIKMRNVDCAIY